MGAEAHDWQALAASALAWWRDAGVDALVDDEPRDWLAPPPSAPSAATLAAAAAAVIAPTAAAALPDTMEAFLAWRLGPEAPDAGRDPPVAPEGPANAALMVVVGCPDGTALIDPAAGQLFDRMLAAIGIERAAIHLAAFTPWRPLAGRIPPEAEATLAPLLRHHVALVRPRAVLCLSQAASRALIGTDAHRAGRNLHSVNLQGAMVHVVASQPPRTLLDEPALKAAAWKDLLLLMGGLR